MLVFDSLVFYVEDYMFVYDVILVIFGSKSKEEGRWILNFNYLNMYLVGYFFLFFFKILYNFGLF